MENTRTSQEPPGGILIWLIVSLELLVFFAAFIFIAVLRSKNIELFRTEQAHLDFSWGVFFTLTLLASGWLIAESVEAWNQQKIKTARILNLCSSFFGLAFVVLKLVDFSHKISQGLTLGQNDFWDYYWLFMSFHFAHVLVGLFWMISTGLKMKEQKLSDPEFSIKGGAVFWHMCDIAWLFLFPLFYLGSS